MPDATKKILVVDDDEGIRRQLGWAFDSFSVLEAGNREDARALVESDRPAVVLLDLGLPPDPDGPSEGLMALKEILSITPDAKIIMISGQSEREHAVRAVGLGAYDFYEKPLELDALNLIVERAFRLRELEQENRLLASRHSGLSLPGVITTNAAMLEICDQARKLAGTDVFVLLLGESGTGKEVLSRAMHGLSARAAGNFVAINCAAIPENLIESELFGHEKGAFTGAIKTTIGKVEQANKGTLFLDEIGDLPLAMQAKLLRFLQERVIERVGGRREITVDIRVISATNRDLAKLIAEGDFREDLFYRLSEVDLKIPPLRERSDDTLLLAHHLLGRVAKQQGRALGGFSREALAVLSTHPWPGNVRELENRIKRAVATSAGPQVQPEDLDLAPDAGQRECLTLKQAREAADKTAIRAALADAKGNLSQAARLLGTSRPTLYQLIEQYDIKD